MHRLNYRLLVVALAACAVGMTGCPGGGPTLDTQYVEGVVTLDDKPVPEATVTFVPVTEGQGMSATGFTDENGVYKLTAQVTGEATAEAEGGTVPGEYYVGVTKTVYEAALSREEAEKKGIEYKPSAGEGESGKVTYVVPARYNNPRESGLKVTVKEGENNIPIKLTSSE